MHSQESNPIHRIRRDEGVGMRVGVKSEFSLRIGSRKNSSVLALERAPIEGYALFESQQGNAGIHRRLSVGQYNNAMNRTARVFPPQQEVLLLFGRVLPHGRRHRRLITLSLDANSERTSRL